MPPEENKLSPFLARFNQTLRQFREKFPAPKWNKEFRSNLVNDYTFFSSRLEDDHIQYGETIQFLNNELVRKGKMKSLLDVANHKDALQGIIDHIDTFVFSEESIKAIHRNLMGSELAWETDFKPELIGNYRNIPTIGYRQPLYPNKEYAPHYNLEMIMASYMDIFRGKFNNIDNSKDELHLLTALAYFHNKFLNEIHPFADGNGRVCRVVMGALLMKHGCPPIFRQILSDKDRKAYIETIITCEKLNSDIPLVRFLAEGMTHYLQDKIDGTFTPSG